MKASRIIKPKESLQLENIIASAPKGAQVLIKVISCEICHSDIHLWEGGTLVLSDFSNIYAIGDCGSIINPFSGKPYPLTSQHAIKQGQLAAKKYN